MDKNRTKDSKTDLAKLLAKALEPDPGAFPSSWTHHGQLSPGRLHTAYFHRIAHDDIGGYEGKWSWKPALLDGNFAMAVLKMMNARGDQEKRDFVYAYQQEINKKEDRVNARMIGIHCALNRLTPLTICRAAAATLKLEVTDG